MSLLPKAIHTAAPRRAQNFSRASLPHSYLAPRKPLLCFLGGQQLFLFPSHQPVCKPRLEMCSPVPTRAGASSRWVHYYPRFPPLPSCLTITIVLLPLLQVLPHAPPPPLLQSSNPCPTTTWVLLPPHIFPSSPWSHHQQHSRTHFISQHHQHLGLTTQILLPTLQVPSSSLSLLPLRSPQSVPPPLLLVPSQVPPPPVSHYHHPSLLITPGISRGTFAISFLPIVWIGLHHPGGRNLKVPGHEKCTSEDSAVMSAAPLGHRVGSGGCFFSSVGCDF